MTYHFRFNGAETAEATVVIRGGKVTVTNDQTGEPTLRITADSATWLGFLAREKPALGAAHRPDQAARQPEMAARFRPLFPELTIRIYADPNSRHCLTKPRKILMKTLENKLPPPLVSVSPATRYISA